MKRRAQRAVIGAAALVPVLVAVLAVGNWGIVRDHVETWWFQLTTETMTIEPDPVLRGMNVETWCYHPQQCLLILAHYRGLPLILERKQGAILYNLVSGGGSANSFEVLPADSANVLHGLGYRVLEQRFPRKAYVVIRADESLEGTVRVARPPDPGICKDKAR